MYFNNKDIGPIHVMHIRVLKHYKKWIKTGYLGPKKLSNQVEFQKLRAYITGRTEFYSHVRGFINTLYLRLCTIEHVNS